MKQACKCALSLLNAMDKYQKFFTISSDLWIKGRFGKFEDRELWQGVFKKELLDGLDKMGYHCDVKADSLKEALNALTIPGVPTTLLEIDEEVGFKIIKLVDDCAKEEI